MCKGQETARPSFSQRYSAGVCLRVSKCVSVYKTYTTSLRRPSLSPWYPPGLYEAPGRTGPILPE